MLENLNKLRDSKGIVTSCPSAYRRPFGNFPFRLEPRSLDSKSAKLLLRNDPNSMSNKV